MPNYANFFKEILSNKRKLEEHEIIFLNEECSAIIMKKLFPKLKDLESFTIHWTISSNYSEHSLCNLDANTNLMPLYVYRSFGLVEAQLKIISL